jgi:hypothetical protein
VGISVGDDPLGYSIVQEYVSGVQLGGVQCIDHFVAWDKDSGFHGVVICDGKN